MTSRADAPGRRPDIEETLMAAIGWGELEPDTVYSVPALARRFGAPAVRVRTALQALVHDGLVERVAHRGVRLVKPTRTELREMIEMRVMLEVPSARQVVERGMSDGQLAELKRLADATMTAADVSDLLGYIRADMEFHLYLSALCGNEELVEVVRLLRARSRIQGLRGNPQPFMTEKAQDHIELVQLAARDDATAVANLLYSHISGIRDDWFALQGSSGRPAR